jgi:uncharacterized protein (TIGR00106 family)
MILAELCIYPVDKGDSLSAYVARSLDIIDRSGLPYRCHAMGTTIEGEFEEVMAVVRQCFEDLRQDCRRVECSVRFDYREGASGRLEGKVASVERRLGRPLRK